MNSMKKLISILVTVLFVVSTFAFLPSIVSAGEVDDTRKVPPSEAPEDGKKFERQTERIDITPEDVTTYKKYKEVSGLYTVVIKPVLANKKSIDGYSADETAMIAPTGAASLVDYISLTNTNGTVTTKSQWNTPPVPPASALEIENSSNPNPNPPPIDINIESVSYVMYDYTGVISNKDVLMDAYIDFTHTVSNCYEPVVVNIHDVGISWSSMGMDWYTKPVCGINNKIDEFTWSPLQRGIPRFPVPNIDPYGGSTQIVGYGFTTIGQITCGINNGTMPYLVLTYADASSEVDSPSNTDLSYGVSGGNISVNPWVGLCNITECDINVPVKNGASVQFKMVHNPNSPTGWSTRYDNMLTIDSNYVAYWTKSDGSVVTFLPDDNGEWTNSPEFSTFQLDQDPITNKFCIIDKRGSKIIFPAPFPPFDPFPIIPDPINPPPEPPAASIYQEEEIEEINDHGCDVEIVREPISGLPIEIIIPGPIPIIPIIVFGYDQYGRLSDITDPEGNVISLSYNANNKITGYTNQGGNTTSYTYDQDGRIISIQDPLNNTATISYTTNANGYYNVVITDATNVPISTVEVLSNSAVVTDANNNSVNYIYDDRGYCTNISAPESVSYSFTWDQNKRLTSSTNPRGYTTSYSYNSDGMVTSVNRADGETISLTYDGINQVTSITDPKNKTTNLSYYSSTNKLENITNPLNETMEFEYTGDNMTKIKTPFEDCDDIQSTADISIEYDGNNYIEKIITPEGEEVEYVKDDNGRVTSYTDKNGTTWEFGYDDDGRLIVSVDPYNNTWTTVYDDAGRVTDLVDPNGNSTHYTYDSNGRLTQVEDAEGNKTTFTRRDDGKVSSVTDPESYTITHTYDDLGRLTSVVNSNGDTKYYHYDKNGNVTRITDGEGNEITYEHDELDRVEKIIDEEDNEIVIVYDDNSNITSITDQLGKITSMVYDDLNRVVSVTNPYGKTWTREFNKTGKLVKLDGPSTDPQEFCYDKDGLLISSVDSNGEEQGYVYDAEGRLTTVTDSLNNTTTISYDLLNRIKRITDSNSKYVEYTYDNVGNITVFKDKRGNETEFTYDDIYRVTEVEDALGNVTKYTHDDNSNITKIESPPQATPPSTNFVYDGARRLTQFTDQLNESGTFSYNDNGLITSKTDRNGDTTNYGFNNLNQLTEIAYSLTNTVDFDYNAVGNLIEMVDSLGITEWTYGDIGELISTDDPWDFTHALTYNDESMIQTITAEGDSRSYTWNSAGLMTGATRDSLQTTFDYNAASWITGKNYPNDVETDYTYSSLGLMTDIDVKDTTTTPATNLVALDYTYDENGNVLTEDVGAETWTNAYDALNRLVTVDKPNTVNDVAYTYDVRGNLTDKDVGGTDNTDLTFNIADRMTRVDYENSSYRVYTYDKNGNCTKEEYFSGVYLNSPVVVPIDETQTKAELLAENEKQQAKRVHYPHNHAPEELRKSKYLSPYLPETTEEDFYQNSMLDWTNPALANFKRTERWKPNSTFPADETTENEYDQENRLTKVTLPSTVEVEFFYDGSGRRLKKVITDDTGDDEVITTWKYHYFGSQITTIEIDEVEIDDSESPPVSTATRDETIHVHFGPNAQAISFEWVRYDYTEEETLDDTYYYTYDIHGSVILVTDDSANVKITYVYDTLGKVTSESNPDSIPNPFKFRAFKQVIYDDYTGLYYGSCYYRPDLGTSLSVSGFNSNPASLKPVSSINKLNKVSTQITRATVLAMSAKAVENEGLSAPGHGEVKPKGDSGNSGSTNVDPNLPDNDDDDFDFKISGGGTSSKNCRVKKNCSLSKLWQIARGRIDLGTIDGHESYSPVPIAVILQIAVDRGDKSIIDDISRLADIKQEIEDLEKELEKAKEDGNEALVKELEEKIRVLKAEDAKIRTRLTDYINKFCCVKWYIADNGDLYLISYAMRRDHDIVIYLRPPVDCEVVGKRADGGSGGLWETEWDEFRKKHGTKNGSKIFVPLSNNSGTYTIESIIKFENGGVIGWKTNKETGKTEFVGKNGLDYSGLPSIFGKPNTGGSTVIMTFAKNSNGSGSSSGGGVPFLKGVRTTNPLSIQSWINPNLSSGSILP